MNKVDSYFLAKKVAKMRHQRTRYDKHLDLMYDENGNQTELRHRINNILARIIRGELDDSYLEGIKSEIVFARRDKLKKDFVEKPKKKKRKNKTKLPSIEKQQALLLRGVRQYEQNLRYKYMKLIGLNPHKLHQLYRKALPYYNEGVYNE